MGFPLTEQRLCDAVKSSIRDLPDYADSIVPTVPQVGQCFGSCVAISGQFCPCHGQQEHRG